MTISYCGICLKETKNSISSNATDENGVKWLHKMQSLVPELEITLQVLLCKDCVIRLEEALSFKQHLTSLVSRLREQTSNYQNFSIVNEIPIESTPKIETDILSPIEVLYESYKLESEANRFNTDLSLVTDEPDIKEETSSIKQSPTQLHSNESHCNSDHELTNTYCDVLSISENVEVTFTDPQHETKFVCSTCNNFYTTERNLNRHKTYCEKKLLRVKTVSVKNSKVRRKSSRTLICEVCNEKFNYLKLAKDHCVKVHLMEERSIKLYLCDICKHRFTTLAMLEKHRKYHTRTRDHICATCGKRFITPNDLASHEKIHFNLRSYKCVNCDKGFNTNKNLRSHVLIVHTDRSQWKYHCDLCPQQFPNKTCYDQHMKRHNCEKKFACDICSKLFVTQSEVRKHLDLHTNIKQFTCTVCQKEFKYKRTMDVHLATIHSIGSTKVPKLDLKFECHICHSKFYTKIKLSKHINKHLGIKPFNCTICESKFLDKYTLKRHIKSHNRQVK